MMKSEKCKAFMKRIAEASPGTVVLLVAGLVLLVGLGSKLMSSGAWSARAYPQVVYEQKALREKRKGEQNASVPADKPLFDGELYRTSLRLQEASDLAIGSVLFAATQKNSGDASNLSSFVETLPKSVDELLKGLASNHMLPPGVTLSGDLVLSSDKSILALRYRPEPFGIEIVSMPREEGKGPGLIVRVTDDSSEKVKYYESMTLTGIQVPEAFQPESKIISGGWMPKLLNGQMVSETELRQAREWLAKEAEARNKR